MIHDELIRRLRRVSVNRSDGFLIAVSRNETGRLPHMKPSILPLILISLVVGFALLRPARALVPLPDGGYPGGNTAEGQNALFSLTDGTYNTAVGFLSCETTLRAALTQESAPGRSL